MYKPEIHVNIGAIGRITHGDYIEAIRDAAPTMSLEEIEGIAKAVFARTEAAALAERPHQRRREWQLIIVSLLLGALLSIPIGIWINSIS
ncbi:hypothetical protein [Streptosporangium roseum]|uniref:hypothetical protein n=1 Tax=Streptosporangium roseum TaxID=2001 RepID=UPI00331EA2C0